VTTEGSCCDSVGNRRSATRESERALRQDEDCTAAWKKRAGSVRERMKYMTRRGRGERDGEEAVIIYVERDLYLRCEQIFWASRRKWVKDRDGK
jgi:hypothetical protein